LAAQLEKANLTDEQKKQIDEIKAKYSAPVAEARTAINGVMTKEQRQARQAATAKAREEGKKGEELKAAVDASLTLSEEQKKSLADAEAKMKTLQTEIRQAVLAVLTDEQKQSLGLNKGKKAKKADKAAQADKPAKGDKAAKAADKKNADKAAQADKPAKGVDKNKGADQVADKGAVKNADKAADKGVDKGADKGVNKGADKDAKGENKDPKGAK
jgi:hypothetical protein